MCEERLIREMAMTAQEFRRVLELAFPGGVIEQDGALGVSASGAVMAITLRVLPPRKIGQLSVPRLEVHIRFRGVGVAQRLAWLAQLERAFQRGGG